MLIDSIETDRVLLGRRLLKRVKGILVYRGYTEALSGKKSWYRYISEILGRIDRMARILGDATEMLPRYKRVLSTIQSILDRVRKGREIIGLMDYSLYLAERVLRDLGREAESVYEGFTRRVGLPPMTLLSLGLLRVFDGDLEANIRRIRRVLKLLSATLRSNRAKFMISRMERILDSLGEIDKSVGKKTVGCTRHVWWRPHAEKEHTIR